MDIGTFMRKLGFGTDEAVPEEKPKKWAPTNGPAGAPRMQRPRAGLERRRQLREEARWRKRRLARQAVPMRSDALQLVRAYEAQTGRSAYNDAAPVLRIEHEAMVAAIRKRDDEIIRDGERASSLRTPSVFAEKGYPEWEPAGVTPQRLVEILDLGWSSDEVDGEQYVVIDASHGGMRA